jgi:hypothetical protein
MSMAGNTWNASALPLQAAMHMRPKFPSSRSPAAWLFSGWNWTAKRIPRPAAAVNGTPYVVRHAATPGSDGTA